jgi:hypothetical protein
VDDFGPWLLSVVSLLIGAIVGTLFGLWRTRTETKWQLKFRAYRRIFSAIEDIRLWAEETYAYNLMLPSPGPEEMGRLATSYRKAKHDLWRFVNVGHLILSDQSRAAINDLMSQIAEEEFSFEQEIFGESEYPRELADHAEGLRKKIAGSLPAIMEAARRDIG